MAAALVSLAPSGLSTTTDSKGEFAFAGIGVLGRFQQITITVSALGFGTWRRVDERLYSGHWAYVDVRLGSDIEVSVATPPASERGESAAASRTLGSDNQRAAILAYGNPHYSDQRLVPPRIGVEHLAKDQNCGPTQPVQVLSRAVYAFDWYIMHVLPKEIAPDYAWESIKANAMAIKNYAWYWVNQGGKSYTGADVDDTTQYQCFDPNAVWYDTFWSAVDETTKFGIHDPGETIKETSYVGYIEGDTNTHYGCTDSNGTLMYQLGSRAWADPPAPPSKTCGDQTYNWILGHYYYSPGPITIFSVPPPATPSVVWKRPNEVPITIRHESKGAWGYQTQKWTGSEWLVVENTRISWPSGSLSTDFFDYNVGTGAWYYLVWASNPGGWSSAFMFCSCWTTDLWNSSFDQNTSYWGRNNGGNWSIVSAQAAEGGTLLRLTPTSSWVSVYQDLGYFNSFVCASAVVRVPTGYGSANAQIVIWGLGITADEALSQAYYVPEGWWSIQLGCRSFANPHSVLRFEIYLTSGVVLDVDRTRLVTDSVTYGHYD